MFPYPLAPEQASEYARRYDLLFATITALTIFFTVVVLVLVVFFAIRYRAGSTADRTRPQHENLRIEVAWSLPPLLLGIGIFAWGATDFVTLRRPPKNAIEIFVIGKQWMWHLQHPNGVREMNQLHVPVGVPVKLTMISQDVIHSFYIPQFRVQYMVVPGRYTYQWFTASKPGRYNLFCAMHCGTQHSEMGGYVYVLPQAEYAAWLQHGGESPKSAMRTMEQAGQDLYTTLNCANCHGTVDSVRAPSLYGIFGRRETMANGETLVADDTYIRDSIINPYAKIVKGYRDEMPEYKTQLTEEQIHSLLEYIRSFGMPAPGKTAVNSSAAASPRNSGIQNTPPNVTAMEPTR
jgi:cytochrome c oxidase subunit 2